MRLCQPIAALAACLILAACAPPREADGLSRRATLVPRGGVDVGSVQAQAFLTVADAIEPLAESECERRNPYVNCDFRIVVDDRPGMPPNAFQTLDQSGRPLIAFTLALIVEVRNADEMAFVMAHEASHHIAGHLARQEENAARGAAVFAELATQMAGATPAGIREAQQIGAMVGARSYSKEFELEADALGAVIAARAGYDPVRGAAFFLRLPDPGNRFMGTHPPNADRIATVSRAVAEMG